MTRSHRVNDETTTTRARTAKLRFFRRETLARCHPPPCASSSSSRALPQSHVTVNHDIVTRVSTPVTRPRAAWRRLPSAARLLTPRATAPRAPCGTSLRARAIGGGVDDLLLARQLAAGVSSAPFARDVRDAPRSRTPRTCCPIRAPLPLEGAKTREELLAVSTSPMSTGAAASAAVHSARPGARVRFDFRRNGQGGRRRRYSRGLADPRTLAARLPTRICSCRHFDARPALHPSSHTRAFATHGASVSRCPATLRAPELFAPSRPPRGPRFRAAVAFLGLFSGGVTFGTPRWTTERRVSGRAVSTREGPRGRRLFGTRAIARLRLIGRHRAKRRTTRSERLPGRVRSRCPSSRRRRRGRARSPTGSVSASSSASGTRRMRHFVCGVIHRARRASSNVESRARRRPRSARRAPSSGPAPLAFGSDVEPPTNAARVLTMTPVRNVDRDVRS